MALLRDLAFLAVVEGCPHELVCEVRRGGEQDEGFDALGSGEGREQRHPAAHGGADEDEWALRQLIDDGEGVGAPAADCSIGERSTAFAVAEIVETGEAAASGGDSVMEDRRLLAQHVGVEAAEPDDAGMVRVGVGGRSGAAAVGEQDAFMVEDVGGGLFH